LFVLLLCYICIMIEDMAMAGGRQMRFLMMIKGDEQSEAGVLPSERLMEAMIKYNDELVHAGALLAAEGLHPTSLGARVKFTGGRPTVTGGPFVPAKEIIAGYWLIQTNSQEAAIEWAKRIPFDAGESTANTGASGQIEVRQVFELEDFPVGEKESGWREAEVELRARAAASPASAGTSAKGLKQFIIFRKADKNSEAGVMPSEELLTTMAAYNRQMIEAGVLLAGEGLKPSSTGARVYYSGGKRSVVDGPFDEATDLIAGFTVIRAKSQKEALDWAKRWPAIDAESEVELEVRQLFGADEFAAEFAAELAEADEFQRQLIAAQQWPPEY
jgi:hypothetical protein